EDLEGRTIFAMMDPHRSAIGQFESFPYHHERCSVQERGPGIVAAERDRISGLQLLDRRTGAFIVRRNVAALRSEHRGDQQGKCKDRYSVKCIQSPHSIVVFVQRTLKLYHGAGGYICAPWKRA